MTTLASSAGGVATKSAAAQPQDAARALRGIAWATAPAVLYWLAVTGVCAAMWLVLFRVSDDDRRAVFARFSTGLTVLDVMTVALAAASLAEAHQIRRLAAALGAGRMRRLAWTAVALIVASLAVRLAIEFVWRRGSEAWRSDLAWGLTLQVLWALFACAYGFWHLSLARLCAELAGGATKRQWVHNWRIVVVAVPVLLMFSLLTMEQPDRALFLYLFWVLFALFMSTALVVHVMMLRATARSLA